MNSLKEVKPLIEWEKYLGVWMVDLLPKQHLVNYTKMEAFEKIGISNVRDWGLRENNLYRELIINNGLLRLECKNYSIIDNIKKPLIEWEKELGYCIVNLSYSEHLVNCTREEAIQMLYGNYLTQSWNELGDKLYLLYTKGLLNYKNVGDNRDVLKNVEYKEVNDVNKDVISSFISNPSLDKKKSGLFKKIASIGSKMSEKIQEKVINVNKKKNKVKVRNAGLKMIMSVTLSLVTALSAYGFSKFKPVECDDTQDISYSNQLNDEIINLNTNVSVYESLLLKDSKVKENNKEEEKVSNKSHNVTVTKEVKKSFDRKKLFSQIINSEQFKNNNIYLDNDINLGDKIILEKGSKVYDNVYSAIDESNGYQTYYSYDTYRNVEYIGLNYNNDIIYSNNIAEINKYKSMGAKVVCVCTADGYYNANDIVKVRTKKL